MTPAGHSTPVVTRIVMVHEVAESNLNMVSCAGNDRYCDTHLSQFSNKASSKYREHRPT